jgi:urease accessory protein
MPRATQLIAANRRDGTLPVDTLILDSVQRGTARATVVSVKGATIDIDLPGPVRLRTDDLLRLDNGDLVEVVAAAESLIEVRAADVAALARLAWHLGDRHIVVELLPNRIRVKRDAAVETLLQSLGAKMTMIDAPFESEGGAYAAPAPMHNDHHDHDHHGHAHHDQHHDHGHDNHGHGDHVHDDHCGHDRSHDHGPDHGHDHAHGHKHK